MVLPQENFQGIVDSLSESLVAAGGPNKVYPPSFGGIVTAIRDLTGAIFVLATRDPSGIPGVNVGTDFTGNGTLTAPLTLSTTGVSAGVYGGPTSFPVVELDSKGRVLSASVVELGTLPEAVITTSEFSGTGTGGSPLALSATGVTASSYGDSTSVATFTVDSKGRLTSASQQPIRSASTAQSGIVQLSSSINSTSTTQAATPSAVKQAYDLATSASSAATTAQNTATTALNTANAAQPGDADLAAIAALNGTGLARRTGPNTWTLDSSTYITGNQNISITGDASGSGTTAIALTLTNTGVAAGSYRTVTVDAKGRVLSGSNPTTLAGYGITDAQALDGDLTAIAALTGTGLARRIADNTWSLDSTSYLSGTVGPANGGTGLATYVLGDILFASAANTLARLAGNTTTTRRFLSQTGTGSASAAPSWLSPTPADVGLGNVPNVDATNASNISSGTLAAARLGTTQTVQFSRVGIGTAVATGLEFDLNGAAGQIPIALGGTAIDASLGNYFSHSISANSTFTISNVPSGRVYIAILEITITSGSPTVSFGSGFTTVRWAGGSAPDFTAGKTHEVSLLTRDGVTWRLNKLQDFDS